MSATVLAAHATDGMQADCKHIAPSGVALEGMAAPMRRFVAASGACVIYNSRRSTSIIHAYSSTLAEPFWLHNVAFMAAGRIALRVEQWNETTAKLLVTQTAFRGQVGLSLFRDNASAASARSAQLLARDAWQRQYTVSGMPSLQCALAMLVMSLWSETMTVSLQHVCASIRTQVSMLFASHCDCSTATRASNLESLQGDDGDGWWLCAGCHFQLESGASGIHHDNGTLLMHRSTFDGIFGASSHSSEAVYTQTARPAILQQNNVSKLVSTYANVADFAKARVYTDDRLDRNLLIGTQVRPLNNAPQDLFLHPSSPELTALRQV